MGNGLKLSKYRMRQKVVSSDLFAYNASTVRIDFIMFCVTVKHLHRVQKKGATDFLL